MTNDRNKEVRSDLNGLNGKTLRNAELRRQLTRMPLFRPDHSASEDLSDLLSRLDVADGARRGH